MFAYGSGVGVGMYICVNCNLDRSGCMCHGSDGGVMGTRVELAVSGGFVGLKSVLSLYN